MRFFGVLILIEPISLLSGLDTARWRFGQVRIVVLDISLVRKKGFRLWGILCQHESYESDELGTFFSVMFLYPLCPCFVLSTVRSTITWAGSLYFFVSCT